MSYLNRAAAALGFAVVTAAGAQTNTDTPPPARQPILSTAGSIIGNATPIQATREGAVLTTKIHDGPMAGQTIKINTATDAVDVTTAKGARATLTSQHSLIAYPNDVRGPIFASGSYNTHNTLSASCGIEKNSVAMKGGTRDPSPENIRYEITCKTNLGNAFLTIAPASSAGVYHYRLGHAIEADPQTGEQQVRILNRIAEFKYK